MSKQAKCQASLQAFEAFASTMPNFSLFSLGPSNLDDYNPSITYPFSSTNPHPWVVSSMYLQHTWAISKRLIKLLPNIKELPNSYNITQILNFCSQMGHYFLKMYGEPKKARRIFRLTHLFTESKLFSSDALSNLKPLILFNMGAVSLNLEKFKKAGTYYTKAHAMCITNDNNCVAESLCYLGEVEKEKKNTNKARQYFTECIAKQKSMGESREQKFLLAQFFGRKAEFERSVGSLSDAIILLEHALDLEIQVFDKISDPVCKRMDSLASTWNALGRQREALRMAQRSLRLSKEFLDGFDPALTPRMSLVAKLQLDLAGSRSSRYLRNAKRLLDSAFDIEIETAGSLHPVVLERLKMQAELELIMGNIEESLVKCHQALGISAHLYGMEKELSKRIYHKCKEVYQLLQQREQFVEKQKREQKN